MKKIIISPYSQRMRNNEINPKNFPHWKELITLLKKYNIEITQIGVEGESKFNVDHYCFNLPLKELNKLVTNHDAWISVDNFFPHFVAAHQKKPGIVIFSKSNPDIYGYKWNKNLLKDKKYLRPLQFDIWEKETFLEESFVSAETVLNATLELLKLKETY